MTTAFFVDQQNNAKQARKDPFDLGAIDSVQGWESWQASKDLTLEGIDRFAGGSPEFSIPTLLLAFASGIIHLACTLYNQCHYHAATTTL